SATAHSTNRPRGDQAFRTDTPRGPPWTNGAPAVGNFAPPSPLQHFCGFTGRIPMKAIEQVIRYLRVRGALSDVQFAYLEREGFWPRDSDDPNSEDDAREADQKLAEADAHELASEEERGCGAAIQRSIAAERRRGPRRR